MIIISKEQINFKNTNQQSSKHQLEDDDSQCNLELSSDEDLGPTYTLSQRSKKSERLGQEVQKSSNESCNSSDTSLVSDEQQISSHKDKAIIPTITGQIFNYFSTGGISTKNTSSYSNRNNDRHNSSRLIIGKQKTLDFGESSTFLSFAQHNASNFLGVHNDATSKHNYHHQPNKSLILVDQMSHTEKVTQRTLTHRQQREIQQSSSNQATQSQSQQFGVFTPKTQMSSDKIYLSFSKIQKPPPPNSIQAYNIDKCNQTALTVIDQNQSVLRPGEEVEYQIHGNTFQSLTNLNSPQGKYFTRMNSISSIKSSVQEHQDLVKSLQSDVNFQILIVDFPEIKPATLAVFYLRNDKNEKKTAKDIRKKLGIKRDEYNSRFERDSANENETLSKLQEQIVRKLQRLNSEEIKLQDKEYEDKNEDAHSHYYHKRYKDRDGPNEQQSFNLKQQHGVSRDSCVDHKIQSGKPPLFNKGTSSNSKKNSKQQEYGSLSPLEQYYQNQVYKTTIQGLQEKPYSLKESNQIIKVQDYLDNYDHFERNLDSQYVQSDKNLHSRQQSSDQSNYFKQNQSSIYSDLKNQDDRDCASKQNHLQKQHQSNIQTSPKHKKQISNASCKAQNQTNNKNQKPQGFKDQEHPKPFKSSQITPDDAKNNERSGFDKIKKILAAPKMTSQSSFKNGIDSSVLSKNQNRQVSQKLPHEKVSFLRKFI